MEAKTTKTHVVTTSDGTMLLGKIIRVDKPRFPRSGLMSKNPADVYSSWNAKECPFAYTLVGLRRYYWFQTLEQTIAAIEKLGYKVKTI